MICGSDEHCLGIVADLASAQRDGDTHFTVWVGVYSKVDRAMIELRAHFIRAMTGDDDGFLDPGRADVVDAGFNYGAIAEGKQWLEGAHAPGTSGGQNNCSNIFHILSRLESPAQEAPKVPPGYRQDP